MPFRDGGRIEWLGQPDHDRVVGLVERRRVAALGRDDLRALDQALRPEEPDRQLRLMTRGPHRDRDRDRILVRAGRTDLQRRLADDPIRPDLERLATHGHDGTRGDVSGRWDARVVHARSVGPGVVRGASLVPMPSEMLDPRELAFLVAARRAILATIDPDGRPRLVPVCFIVDAVDRVRIITPLDDKPKATDDKRALARVRDIRARPQVSILVERWDEDWSRLAWLRLDGRAMLLEPGEVRAPDASNGYAPSTPSTRPTTSGRAR